VTKNAPAAQAHPNALLLDALLAHAATAERNPDGTLTEEAKADLHRIAALAEDPEAVAEIQKQADGQE
jgi:hypothetical protein